MDRVHSSHMQNAILDLHEFFQPLVSETLLRGLDKLAFYRISSVNQVAHAEFHRVLFQIVMCNPHSANPGWFAETFVAQPAADNGQLIGQSQREHWFRIIV